MLRVRGLVVLCLFAVACGRSMLPLTVSPERDAGTRDGSTVMPGDPCDDDADCDDGKACDGTEVCERGTCAEGALLDCDDGVACTTDVCDGPLDRCVNTPDSSVCAGGEICDASGGCLPKSCSGDAACDDGFLCNGAETCGISGLCVPGTAVVCADAFGCTTDVCSPTTGLCVFTPDDSACADGSFCNGIEVCDPAAGCVAAPRPACETMNACSTAVCDEATQSCATTQRDQDQDGAIDAACGGDDCDDTNPAVRPAATESCANTIDDDCDGQADCADASCAGTMGCCVPTPESCTNGTDDDCDGQADCADANCAAAPACCVPAPESCSNGRDDDCDGLVDCADTAACAGSASCCTPSPEQCRNGRDDDCDGQTDCTDSQCVTNILCQVPCLPTEICFGDLVDADCDGRPGCLDTQCVGSRFCR